MADPQTAHYDTFENTGRSVLVLDSIRAVCEAINNDALAASKEQPIVAGIENPASTLGTDGTLYTTIPLRPLTGDCNFLQNNYIHLRIPVSIPLKCVEYGTDTAHTPLTDIDYAIYVYGSSLIPKRFQLMIGNTIIYQNTFQRTEATVAINSLPPDVVEKSDDITTMSKLLNRKVIPGQYFTWKGIASAADPSTFNNTSQNLNFSLDTTIDLSRFSPILSNIAFIPVEYGDLKLRLFFDDFFNALDITVLPNNNGTVYNSTAGEVVQVHNNLHVLERRPLLEGASFREPDLLITNGTTVGAGTGTFTTTKGQQITFTINTPAVPRKGTAYSWGGADTIVEIVQSTFRLREESKILLKNYIMSDNRLIIPTHTWSTALALTPAKESGGSQFMWNFTAYNIDMLAFTFPPDTNYESYLPNPVFTTFDVKLNSKSVNYIPYDNVFNSRMIKDTKQAFLNTDEYATNENLTYSLKPIFSIPESITDASFKDAIYRPYAIDNSSIDFKPNAFCYAINLSPPNSFEKGMCVSSSNPQAAQLRIAYKVPGALMAQPTGAGTIEKYNPLWSNIDTYTNTSAAPPFVLALQGCCLVLIYNPIVGACQAGEVVFVEPFLN